jgi:hypothetical protein
LLHDNNPNEQEVAAFFCDKLSTGRGSTFVFCQNEPNFCGGARPKWGSDYDWSGLYIHGVVRGWLGKRADASTKRTF